VSENPDKYSVGAARTINGPELSAWLEGRLGTAKKPVGDTFASDEDAADKVGVPTQTQNPSATRAKPGPAPAAPPAPAKLVDDNFKPLKYDNAADFIMFFNEEFELDPWQCEELLRLSGFVAPGRSNERVKPTAQNPMLYNLVATNGSGKDAVILCGWILYQLACCIRAKVIATSFTESQVDAQTFAHCKYYAEKINQTLGFEFFQVKYLDIFCPSTGSHCMMFVTNQAGRAEGYHANAGTDFTFIVNEAKSIPDELFTGFIRYTGWNRWIEVSSAGRRGGHFYRRVSSPEAIHYPNPLQLGLHYVRYIKAKDCPRIMQNNVRIREIIREFGVDSPVYKSVVESAFSDEDEISILIKPSATEYENPARNTYGLNLVAGVDLALGGDETVVSIWHGNHRVHQRTLRERYEPTLHKILISIFEEFNLQPENIAADAGGLGKPVIQRLHEAGWEIMPFNFGGGAKNKKYYLNRGAELWQRLKRLVEEKLIVLPRDDQKFMDQLTSRRFTFTNGKMKLESKDEVRARGEPSPDRADAAVIAWSLIDHETFDVAMEQTAREEEKAVRVRAGLPYEQALKIVQERQFKPETRSRGPSGFGFNKGRVAGKLCQLLGVRMR